MEDSIRKWQFLPGMNFGIPLPCQRLYEGEQNCWFNLEGTEALLNWLRKKLGQEKTDEIRNIQSNAKQLLDNYESNNLNHILYNALEQFQTACKIAVK